MDFDPFINAVKQVRSVPSQYLAGKLANALQFADAGVHSTFFGSAQAQPYLSCNAAADQAALARLSVQYLSYALHQFQNMGFGAMVTANWDTIQAWFTQYTSTVGQDMMTDYLMQPSVLGTYFADGPANAAAIAAKVANNDFLTGLLVECDTLGSDLPPKVLLLTLRLLDNDGPNYKRVLQAWVVNDRWTKDLEGFDRYPWLDDVQAQLNQGGAIYNSVYSAVTSACSSSTSCHVTEREPGDPYGPASHDHIITVYGAGVAQWANSAGGPPAYGLSSGAQPQNQTDVKNDGPGCVVAGTPILLADGSTKPIEMIVEGDRIMSGGGVVSVASAEMVVNDHLTTLYSINEDPVFMSLEHALMTQRGWCSLAPALTQDFVPHHSVAQLRVGDVVWKVCGCAEGAVQYEKVVVERINIEVLEAGTAPAGYDLHLRGHASYHAHGYCTLVTYPEITTQRIAANVLTRMSLPERVQFEQTLVALEPMLSKAFGKGVVHQVSSVLGDLKSVAARAAHTDANGVNRRPLVGAEHLVVPRLQVVPRVGSTLATDLKELGVTHGTLSIGGQAVDSRADGRHLHWQRPMPDGTTETGVLRFASHGLKAEGAVNYGGQTQLFTAVGMVGYTTTYAPANTPWCQFEMGFVRDDKGLLHATGLISNPANPAGDADLQKYSTVVFSVTQSSGIEVFRATVSINPEYCQIANYPWVAAEIAFTSDYTHFTGTLYPFAVDQPGYRGTGAALTGTCTDLARLQQLLGGTSAAMLRMPLANDRLAAAPAAATAAHPLVMAGTAMLDSLPMSPENLYDMPAPDMAAVHAQAFAKMRSLMLLAVSRQQPDWLGFLGETAPPVGKGQTLSDADAALLDTASNASFLVERFATGYLTQAFRGSNDQAIKDVFAALPGVDDKLGYFWKGDGTTSFAKDPAYSAMTSVLLDSAYRDTVGELRPYLEGDRVSWARQLYDYCTKEPTLSGLALNNTVDGRQRLTHLSTLLHTLDPVARVTNPDGRVVSFATSLWERVMDVRLNEIVTFSSAADKDDYVAFLTEFFRQYFASLLTDQWIDEIRTQAAKDLHDLMEEYRVDKVNALVDALSSIIVQAVDVLINTKGTMPARLRAWAEANPNKATAISVAMSIGVYVFGVFESIKAFLNWKDLNDAERTAAVTGVLQTAVSIFNDFARFKAARALTAATSSLDEVMAASGEITDAMRLTRLTTACNKISIAIDIEMDVLHAPGLAGGGAAAGAALNDAENLADASARWTKIANVTEVVAHCVTLAAMAAGCVATGFQIANDFATGQPPVIKAFDILEEISSGVAFIVEGVVTIVALTGAEVCSAIPIVGTVAAVIGIIIAFVTMFLQRKPPPTPQEVFVSERSQPFVTGLVVPPTDWVTAQRKVDAHLSGGGTGIVGGAMAFA